MCQHEIKEKKNYTSTPILIDTSGDVRDFMPTSTLTQFTHRSLCPAFARTFTTSVYEYGGVFFFFIFIPGTMHMAHLQETLHMAHGTWHIAHGTFTRHYAHGRRHHAHGTSTRHDAHGTYTRHHAHCTRHHAHGIGPISPSTGRLIFGVLAREPLDCLLSFRCDLAVDPTTDLLTPRRTPFP